MRRGIFIVFGVFLFFYGTTSEAATPTVSLVNYYVSTMGWDGNDGLSTATAFGSITRAVQALDSLEAANNTTNARVLLSPGSHISNQIILDYQNLSYVEFSGDPSATFFTSMMAANVVIQNSNLNSTSSLIGILNCSNQIVIQSLGIITANTNTFGSMVLVAQSNSVDFIDVTMSYTVNALGNVLQNVLGITNASNVSLSNVKIHFDDTNDFNTGVVQNINMMQSQDVTMQNCSLTATHPSGGANAQPLIYATQTTNVSVLDSLLSQTNEDANAAGIILAPDSSDIIINSCGVSGNATGIFVDNNWNTIVQNCWVVNSGTGIELNDARNAKIVNNTIKNNWTSGITIRGECIETRLFNNLIINNGGTTGPQLIYDFSPLTPSGNSPPWQSGYNLICPQSGQSVGRFDSGVTETIYNIKEWYRHTGQDEPGISKCYPLSFSTQPFIPDSGTVSWEGFGSMDFGTQVAPSLDYLGQIRPYTVELYPDVGCFEVNDADLLHHFELTPNITAATEGNTINVTVHMRASRNQSVSATPNYPVYLFLEDPNAKSVTSISSGIEPTGVIDSPDYPVQVTGTAGLYWIEGSAFSGTDNHFRITASRSSLDGRTPLLTVRAVEWGDWYNTTSLVYGGRADDGSAHVRWTNTPQAQSSMMTATSPILASGQSQDYSLLRMTVRDSEGDGVMGLTVDQFSFTGTGGPYEIDLSTFQEDSFNVGVYQVEMRSTDVGTRVMTATVAGSSLNTVSVEFQAGIYGDVFAEDTNQPLPDIRLQLRQQNGAMIGETYSDINGGFRILVPTPLDESVTLSAVDLSDRYVRQDRVYDWTPTTVQSDRIVMNDSKPPKVKAYAYPNPVKRGETITLVYEAPRSGKATLEIFDMRGKRLITLLDEVVYAGQGRVAWQGQNRFDRQLAPGTYLVVMRMGDDVSTWKLVIIP